MENELPDDLSKWPTDPYQLFGVPKIVDLKTIKRTYARLIRKFQPEHFPDQFQRIREAYETLKTHIEWQDRYDHNYESNSESVTASSLPINEAEISASNHSGADASAVLRPDRMEIAWEHAKEGSLRRAYAELLELQRLRPEDEEIAIRLFWLRRCFDDSQENQSAIDLIMPCLQKQGVQGRLGQLFIDQAEGDPNEYFNDRFPSLLTSPHSKPARHALFEERWRLAILDKKPKIIIDDLKEMEQYYIDDIGAWLSLHVAGLVSLVHAINCDTARQVDQLKKSFDTNEEHGLKYYWIFDSFDETLGLWRERQRLKKQVNGKQTPTAIVKHLESILRNRLRAKHDRENATLKQLRMLPQQPEAGLALLDKMMTIAPTITSQLLQSAQEIWYARDETDPRQVDIKAAILRDRLLVLCSSGQRAYLNEIRGALAYFCIAHHVDPGLVIHHLFVISSDQNGNRHLDIQQLKRDFPLLIWIYGQLLCS
ncbi:J domain-containing protein [Planctomicrobium sp. SH668]|uniref:J domain-containing protein n=1 Tax=Planctomicrobium sp. SH668 TaxID=3448126 RepID=UPI003F5B7C11